MIETISTRRFTPVHNKTGVRAEMKISEFGGKAFDSVRGTRKWVCVRDYVTNTNYMVRWATCGLKCQCDAVYKEM